jgi:hypothetical protein
MVAKMGKRRRTRTSLGVIDADPTVEPLEEALCRTLVANFTLRNQRTSTQYCGIWRMWEQELSDGKVNAMREDTWKGVEDFDDSCIRTTMGRRFSVTRNGLMGVTNPNTRPGGQVAILLGGKTPFVIRDHCGPNRSAEEVPAVVDGSGGQAGHTQRWDGSTGSKVSRNWTTKSRAEMKSGGTRV